VEVVEVEVEVVKNKGGLICHLTWRPSFESLSYRSSNQMIGSEPVRIYNQSNVLDLKLVEKSIRTGILPTGLIDTIHRITITILHRKTDIRLPRPISQTIFIQGPSTSPTPYAVYTNNLYSRGRGQFENVC